MFLFEFLSILIIGLATIAGSSIVHPCTLISPKSLLRFDFPPPHPLSAPTQPIVPTQYFTILFSFIAQHGWITAKEGELLSGNVVKRKDMLFSRITTKKSVYYDLETFMSSFLTLPKRFSCTWAEIFYTRLIRSPHVIGPAQLLGLKSLLFLYIEKKTSQKCSQASTLLTYLNTHHQDVDNSLIGLTPNEAIISQYKKFFASKKEIKGAKLPQETTYTADQLLLKIKAWSELPDDEIGAQIRNFTSTLKYDYLNLLTRGDLVVVRVKSSRNCGNYNLLKKELSKEGNPFIIEQDMLNNLPKSTIIIARFYKRDGNRILIWESPDEIYTVSVKLDRVFPFTREMRELLTSERGMKRLVEDEVDKTNLTLKDNVKNLVVKALQRSKISMDLIERINENKIGQGDLIAMRETEHALILLSEDSNLQDHIEHHVQSTINLLEPNVSLFKVFHPNRDQILNSFATWPYVSLATNRIRRYIGICRGGIDHIHAETSSILNGKLKTEISTWWLGTIRTHIHGLLKKKGYRFEAINNNYIDKAPEDISLIESNLVIVRNFLANDGHSDYDLVSLAVNPLTKVIYPKLEEFEKKLTLFLLSQPFPHSSCLASFSSVSYGEDVERALREKLITVELKCKLLSIAEDVNYIQEMKKSEARFGLEAGSMSDVVPISGLAINYFHRMEMELRTIMEIWKPKTKRTVLARTSSPQLNQETVVGQTKSPEHFKKSHTLSSSLHNRVQRLPKPPLTPSKDMNPSDLQEIEPMTEQKLQRINSLQSRLDTLLAQEMDNPNNTLHVDLFSGENKRTSIVLTLGEPTEDLSDDSGDKNDGEYSLANFCATFMVRDWSDDISMNCSSADASLCDGSKQREGEIVALRKNPNIANSPSLKNRVRSSLMKSSTLPSWDELLKFNAAQAIVEESSKEGTSRRKKSRKSRPKRLPPTTLQ